MTARRFVLCSGLIALAIGWISWRTLSAVHAQQPDGTTLKSEARLVLVDTVVTDKKGKYVHDLTQKDFKVWEDNKEQTVKTFSYESEGNPSGPNQKHYLVLFFDNSSMDFGEQARARDAAGKFIDANAGPNREMAIVEFGGTLRVTQNFTASADRLKQVVTGTKTSTVASNPSGDNSGASITSPQDVQVASLGAPPMGMPSLSNPEAAFGARSVLLALRDLAKNLASVPGRKTVVMLTSGFPLSFELQSELTATIDACNKYNVAVYPIDARGLVAPVPGPSGSELMMPNHGRVMNATFKYVGDETPAPHLLLVQHGMPSGGSGGRPGGGGGAPSGGGAPGGGSRGSGGTPAPSGGKGGNPSTGGSGNVPVGNRGGGAAAPISSYYDPTYQPRVIVPSFPPSATDNQQVLYSLANGTGGFVILNTNDLLGGMQRIANELSEYYVLGYVPAETPEGSCHTLKVKVERSDTVVRSRSGYCNVRPADMLAGKPVEKELENQANGSQTGTITASMQTPYFYTSPNVARVNLSMDIPTNSIKFEKVKGKQHATLNILGIAYKGDNSVAARFSDSVNLDFDGKREVEEFAKQPFHYENQFDVASGQYALKVVFSAGGEAFGKLESPLTIEPYDGKQFVMSAMALSNNIRRVSEMATGLDAALMEDHTPLVSQGFQIVPAATYRFKKTDNAAIYAEVYEPLLTSSTPQVGVEMKVTDRKTGEAKIDTGVQNAQTFIQKGNPVMAVGMKLPVAKLDPGSYRVAMQAVDSAGNKTPARSADFEVE